MDAQPATSPKSTEGVPAPKDTTAPEDPATPKKPSPETAPLVGEPSAPEGTPTPTGDSESDVHSDKNADKSHQIPVEQRLAKEDLDYITKKMGHIGRTALIAATLSKEDRKNVINEAVVLKDKGLKKYTIPLIGNILKAVNENKNKKAAENAIDQSGNLADAFTALGLKPTDSKIINSDSSTVSERAWQLLQDSNYGDQTKEKSENGFKPDVVTSHLDEKETVEKVDEATQKAVKEALNEYYFGLKKGNVKEEDLAKVFNDKVDSALKNEKDPVLLKKALDAEKAGLKEIADEKKDCDNQVKAYLDQYLTLYRTNMREGIYTQKQVEVITAGVMNAGLAGGVAAALATRVVGSLLRSTAGAMGIVGAGLGATVGAGLGAISASQKAKIKIADSEIDAATTYEKRNYHPAKETGDKSNLDRIEILRHRRPAADLIKELDEKISRYDDKDDNSQKELLDLYSDILARSQFSSDKKIDLIQYRGNDHTELEKRINAAEKKLLNTNSPEVVSNYKADPKIDLAIKEHKEKLEERFDQVKSVTSAIMRRNILEGAAKGALIGAATSLGLHVGMHLAGDFLSGRTPDVRGAFAFGSAGAENAAAASENAAAVSDNTAEELAEESSIFKGQADVEDFLEGKNTNIDLTNEEEYQSVYEELRDNYNIDLQREAIDTSRYGEMSIGNYLEDAKNAVDNSGGVDWSRSATRVIFGSPTVLKGDGMDEYAVSVSGINGGAIPDGAKFYLDLDGEGPGQALEYEITNGQAIIPADVLDTSQVGNGGVASFIGTARVGEMDGDTMISYATAFGKDADLSTTISASTEESGFAFTAIDMDDNESISQFAIKSDNTKIDNLSEIFNGRTEHLPKTFTYNDIGDTDAPETITLASGEQLSDLDYQGGYHAEFDSYENDLLIESKSYLGTPIQWDANGDGEMNAAEEASYFRQLLVRTGTNPFILGQNASNYGLLEPERLEDIIPRTKLIEWGIKDGVVDSEKELNLLLSNLKQSENTDFYDALANATINEMEKQLDGGGFTVETITDRISTYANSNHQFDTVNASTKRIIIFPHDANGKPVGNIGWLCRKYGVEGGKVGNLPLCGLQAGTEIDYPSTPGTSGEEVISNKPSDSDEIINNEDSGDEGDGGETDNDEGGDEGGGDEDNDIDSKDPENTKRIDNNIEEETEQDYGTEEVENHDDLDKGPETDQPTSEEYQGTEPETSPSGNSQDATPAQNQSSSNNYSDNQGGAHDNEYSPVKEDQNAVETADNRNDQSASDSETEETYKEAGID